MFVAGEGGGLLSKGLGGGGGGNRGWRLAPECEGSFGKSVQWVKGSPAGAGEEARTVGSALRRLSPRRQFSTRPEDREEASEV